MNVQIENGYDDDYHHQISHISATHFTASGGVRRRNSHSILCFQDRIKAVRYDGNVRLPSVHLVVDPSQVRERRSVASFYFTRNHCLEEVRRAMTVLMMMMAFF